MKSLKLHEWAWVAGLIEGEGCFSTTKKHPNPCFQIQMKDEDVIAKLAEMLGTKYTKRPPRNERCQPMYQIMVRRQNFCEWLITGIYRWMGERRQAKLNECIAYYQSKGSNTCDHLILSNNTEPMCAL